MKGSDHLASALDAEKVEELSGVVGVGVGGRDHMHLNAV
jgi:hypothetical protein